jgi:hypothetical protein
MLEHLRSFAFTALETADVNAQLFAAEAEKTIGLIDVLMQEYDVVVKCVWSNKDAYCSYFLCS